MQSLSHAASINRTKITALVNTLFLVLIFGTVAAASFSGFYIKWGLRDDYSSAKERRYNLPKMLDGTADRPFVYRQLIPMAANLFDRALPPSVDDVVINHLVEWDGKLKTHLNIDPVSQRAYLIRYHFVYAACVALLFAAMLVMRQLLLEFNYSRLTALLTPPVFALMLPYFENYGGFYYDFPEIFFLVLGFLLASRGDWISLIPVTILATLNKEAYFFYLIALFPLLRTRLPDVKAGVVVLGLMFVAGLTYLGIKHAYQGNPGASFESWLVPSLLYYADLRHLFGWDVNYGMITPRAYGIFSFAVIGLLVARAWRYLAEPVRAHILFILPVNILLVLVFCGPGEMRNFSLCYMGLIFVLAQNISNWLASEPEVRTASQPSL